MCFNGKRAYSSYPRDRDSSPVYSKCYGFQSVYLKELVFYFSILCDHRLLLFEDVGQRIFEGVQCSVGHPKVSLHLGVVHHVACVSFFFFFF